MIFTVDVGNTNIVTGVFDNDENLVFTARMATQSSKTADEYAVDFKNILGLYDVGINGFDGAIISTVVPSLMPVLKEAIKKLLKCRVIVVSSGIKTGLNIKIDDPAILGADLVCGAVGAMAKYPLPLIVFDMGTATTISAIDRNGCFLGGTIFPGVKVSLKALSSGTAQLPDINTELNGMSVIGKNSADSMKSGIVFGTACMVDGMIERYKEEIGDDATVVATGGIAPTIVTHCKNDIIVDETLLTDGLLIIYKKNSPEK